MASAPLGVLVGAVVTYVFLWALQHLTQNANEPPVVSSSIPFLGPILGMAKHKGRFHRHLRDQTKLPIYTLRLPGTRMYVVNSTNLVSTVQRQYRSLSFAAIEAHAAEFICSLSKAGTAIVQQGLMEDDSYTGKFASAIHPAMAPGPNLDALNRSAAQTIASSLDKFQTSGIKNGTLYEWVRDEIVMATSDAVYGPHNPLRDPEVLKAWYEFEPKVMLFVLGLPPRIFARDALKARQRMIDAFVAYFKAGYYQRGSTLIQCRYQHSSSFGFSIEDTARAEIGGLFAVLGSTGPACFWAVYHLFSDPVALEGCRAEVEALVVHDDSHGYSTIDITSVKTQCPVLLSTLQEVLRFRHIGVSARIVLDRDQLLDGKYYLKKGSTLMIPTPVYHSDPQAWGPNVSTFYHRRFVFDVAASNNSASNNSSGQKTNASKQKSGFKKNSIPRASYRPFGGGHGLCPGRHFATTEILAFVTLVMLRFDISPGANGRGKWPSPLTIEKSPMVAALPIPDDHVPVEFHPREPRRKWHVDLLGSDQAIGIAVEDR